MVLAAAVYASICAPLAASVILVFVRSPAKAGILSAIAALVSLASSLVLLEGKTSLELAGGELVVGSLEAYNLLIVSIVYLLSALSLASAMAELAEERVYPRLYAPMLNMCFAVMALLAVSNNMFMIWVLLELSTLLTVYLVAAGGGRAAEAAWKYLLLCGIGMAFSLYGLVLVYSVGVEKGIGQPWLITRLAGRLPLSPLLVLASAFIVAGFSVKAGLFPAYMWLTDAHSEALHPVSALLSGALIYLAVYALHKMFMVLSCSRMAVELLYCQGVVSILVGAAGIIRTTDIKRLYAYSSIEHMGILASLVALHYGLGDAKLSYVAFNIHALGHAAAKASAFIAAGSLAYMLRSRRIESLELSVDRVIGWGLLVHTLMLAAIPPSPLFISELLGLAAASHNIAVLASFTIALFAAFAALALRIADLYAEKDEPRILLEKLRLTGYEGFIRIAVLVGILVCVAETLGFVAGANASLWG